MTRPVRFVLLALVSLLTAAPVYAQAPTTSQQSTSGDDATRAATTTADGDTGLWYTPTAEVLARGKWSASGYRVSQNYTQGFSNVADFPLTFAVGLGRAEVFGSFKAITRIDRDIRPIFTTNNEVGGVIGPYPYVRQGWSGSKVGDFLVGAKVNLLSEADNRPVALAVKGMIKLPTGDQDAGVSTGKTDGFLDFIVSKDVRGFAEISGYAGGAFRSSTDEVSQSSGLRWGIGGGFPSRGPLRFTAELNGERPSDDATTLSSSLTGIDGSVAPASSLLRSYTAGTLGLTYRHSSGFFAGVASTWAVPREDRDLFRTDGDAFGDFVDFQFRIGFHPGVRRFVPPPPPRQVEAPPIAPPPPPPANRPPAFDANPITANPPTVEAGQPVQLTANASDPDGDNLTYRWTAPVGTFTNPNARQTEYRAPADFEGPVEITVTATDGRGGTASSSMTIMVRRPAPVVELSFEDVYFDFDRSTLRPEAQRLLDDAVTKLMANPTKNLVIEGHTCNIGTAEYNLALGERRAKSVQDYLVAHGVPVTRLETRSFGEEQPKFDNSREETRRLNRRAALVVRVQ